MNNAKVWLKPGREKALRFGHPWIFSGAIRQADAPSPGAIVTVCSHQGHPLAQGTWQPDSQIRVRLWSFDAGTPIDQAFFTDRVMRAAKRREGLAPTNGYRLLMSEADGLSGYVVDRFNDWLVLQCLSAGADAHRQNVIVALSELPGVTGIIDASTDSVRKKEKLPSRFEQVHGDAGIPDEVTVLENGLRFFTTPGRSQKSGFFFDQRDNRQLIRSLAKGADVLDAFSYTGGFGVAAARGGAKSVTFLDRSEEAIAMARRNIEANAHSATVEDMMGNAFDLLRDLVAEGRKFSLINLDPPKFAASAAQVQKATRGYKDVNMLAMQLLAPGGILATYTCSGHVGADLFQKVVFGAACDVGRPFLIDRLLRQASCHPVHLNIPETLYLKGLLLRCAL